MSRDQSPLLPAEFHVVWRGRRCGGLPSDSYPTSYTSIVALADITPTDTTVPKVVGRTGAIRTIRDFGPAMFADADADPANKANLDKLAKRYVQDWLDWQVADDPGDTLVSGIVAPTPCGLIDLIEFAYDRDECYTRVQSPPFNTAPDELAHNDPGGNPVVSGCADSHLVTSDYAPGVLIDMPVSLGGPGGDTTFGLLSLEGGQLSMVFFKSTSNQCICVVPPTCRSVCLYTSDCDAKQQAGLSFSLVRKGTITGITLTDGGAGYTVPPFVSIYMSGMEYESVHASINSSGAVSALTITNHGDGATGPSNVVITPQNVDVGHITRPATATVTIGDVTIGSCTTTGEIWRIALDCYPGCSAGRGYWVTPNVTIAGNAKAHATRTGGRIFQWTVTDQGAGYTTVPNVVVTDQPAPGTTGGTGAHFIANLLAGQVHSLTQTSGGGFYQAPLVTIDPPPLGGTQATATITPSSDVTFITLQGIVVDDRGSGYSDTSPPSVTIDPPTGTGGVQAIAKAQVTIQCCIPVEEFGGYHPVLNGAPSGMHILDVPLYRTINVGDCVQDTQNGIGVRPDKITIYAAVIPPCNYSGPLDGRDSLGLNYNYMPPGSYSIEVQDYQGNPLGTMSASGDLNSFDVSNPPPTPPGNPNATDLKLAVTWQGAWTSRISSIVGGVFVPQCQYPPFKGFGNDAILQATHGYFGGPKGISGDITPGYVCCGIAQYPIPPTLHVSGGGSCTLHLVTCGPQLGGVTTYVGGMSIDSGGSRMGWGPPRRNPTFDYYSNGVLHPGYDYCIPKPAGGNINVQVAFTCSYSSGEYVIVLRYPSYIVYGPPHDYYEGYIGPCVWMTWDQSAWCGEVATDPSPVDPLPYPANICALHGPVGIGLVGGGYLSDPANPPFDLTITCVPAGSGFPPFPCDARPGMGDQAEYPVPSVTLHITE